MFRVAVNVADPPVPEEADVLARVGDLPVDLGAMAVCSNVFRAAQRARSHLERTVLRRHDLSWAGFSALFHVWVWGPMETRALAESMGVARPTVSGVADTLQRRGLVRREGDHRDRRLCRIAATADGERLIQALFPEFNAGESALTAGLDDDERATLARLLRRVVHNAKEQQTA
ncbi:MAG TPA: MarR family transcriptional regulator [Solirubrobacteraceae bacterium]|nr:MarR family transcriptional regulator [Solirubrobacteraceae bacterium]